MMMYKLVVLSILVFCVSLFHVVQSGNAPAPSPKLDNSPPPPTPAASPAVTPTASPASPSKPPALSPPAASLKASPIVSPPTSTPPAAAPTISSPPTPAASPFANGSSPVQVPSTPAPTVASPVATPVSAPKTSPVAAPPVAETPEIAAIPSSSSIPSSETPSKSPTIFPSSSSPPHPAPASLSPESAAEGPANDDKSGSDSNTIVFLPQSVHNLLRQICIEKNQPWPDADVRRELASLSEEKALEVLHSIYNNSQDIRTLNGFIKFMIRKCSSPSPSRIVPTSYFQEQPFLVNEPPLLLLLLCKLDFERFSRTTWRPWQAHLVALGELEFRKQFLILSYAGEEKLKNMIAPEDIRSWKDLAMVPFEQVWEAVGKYNISNNDRRSIGIIVLIGIVGRHVCHCCVSEERVTHLRFPRILSKTTTLEVDWSLVNVNEEYCLDESGNYTYRDGKQGIHTDGTGFISEDLALLCPKVQLKGE
ncbi:hypothetical protein M0R45_016466 [Rubus argutus]|uniref:Uncharacterized protein n=1 Tax=Rubus argutus TaxID=59490 RepID=A0AAW1XV45_RUBAR